MDRAGLKINVTKERNCKIKKLYYEITYYVTME
jgi:hypothetical protein